MSLKANSHEKGRTYLASSENFVLHALMAMVTGRCPGTETVYMYIQNRQTGTNSEEFMHAYSFLHCHHIFYCTLHASRRLPHYALHITIYSIVEMLLSWIHVLCVPLRSIGLSYVGLRTSYVTQAGLDKSPLQREGLHHYT